MPKVSPCSLPSHSLVFLCSLNSSSRTCISIYCLIEKGKESLRSYPKKKLAASYILREKPRWCNCSQFHLRKITAIQSYYNAGTDKKNTCTYPLGVHGCDQYAATLQWAFQHFWSDQQPAHSFPLSQYLQKHIFREKYFLINYP